MELETFDDIEVGDEVIMSHRGGWHSQLSLAIVTRLTPTQIIIGGGMRFRRKDGREVGQGDAWDWNILHHATDKYRAQLAEQKRENAVKDVWSAIRGLTGKHLLPDTTLDTLREIQAQLERVTITRE